MNGLQRNTMGNKWDEKFIPFVIRHLLYRFVKELICAFEFDTSDHTFLFKQCRNIVI